MNSIRSFLWYLIATATAAVGIEASLEDIDLGSAAAEAIAETFGPRIWIIRLPPVLLTTNEVFEILLNFGHDEMPDIDPPVKVKALLTGSWKGMISE